MSTQEHKYAQALRWVAEGKDVQIRVRGEWVSPMSYLGGASWGDILAEGDGWEFRLKPRTVKIGSREIEAPVLEPAEGQTVYRAVEDEEECVAVDFCVHFKQIAAEGRYFLSPEAALAARAAVVALLRGEA